MPAKSTKSAETAKPKRPAAKRRSTSPGARASAKRRQPGYDEIAERAYFIHLEEGSSDAVANWLRAERELKAA
jgi:hypothetical protein